MTYPAEVLADTPRLYWRLGESSGTVSVDASGNGRNGTYVGAPTLGTAGLLTGDPDTAVLFNGTTQRVTYADTADLTAFTVECWYKGTATGGTLMARDNGSSQRLFYVTLFSGKIEFVVWTSGAQFVDSPLAINDNVRHHVVCTYDGAILRVYVDGVQTGTPAPKTGALPTADCPFSVAGSPTFSDLSGVVDEVAYYTTALSAARVLAHYTAGAPPAPKTGTGTGAYTWAGTATGATSTLLTHVLATYPTGLAGGWKFNEGITNGTVIDYSGAAHHMTLTNGTPSGSLLANGSGGSVIFGAGSNANISNAAWMNTTSVSAFIRVRTPTPMTGFGAILNREDQIHLRRDSGTFSVFQWPGSGAATPAAGIAASTTYSVGVSFNGSTCKIYVDGVLAATGAAGAVPLTSTKPFVVGNFGIGGNERFLGAIGPVYHWVGRDLTAAEHLDLHTVATTAPPGVPTSVAITGATETTLTLSWSAPASGGTVTFYEGRVNGAYTGHQTSPWTVGGLPSGGAPFTPGNNYNLEVRAVGPGGASAYVLVTGTTLNDYTLTFVATGLPMKINSAGTWIPVKALT